VGLDLAICFLGDKDDVSKCYWEGVHLTTEGQTSWNNVGELCHVAKNCCASGGICCASEPTPTWDSIFKLVMCCDASEPQGFVRDISTRRRLVFSYHRLGQWTDIMESCAFGILKSVTKHAVCCMLFGTFWGPVICVERFVSFVIVSWHVVVKDRCIAPR